VSKELHIVRIRLCLSSMLALSGLFAAGAGAQQTSQSVGGVDPAVVSPYTQKRAQGYTSFDNPYAAGGIYDPYRGSQITSSGAKGSPHSSVYANTGLGSANSIQLSGQGSGMPGQGSTTSTTVGSGSAGSSGASQAGSRRLASKSVDSCGGNNQSGGSQPAGSSGFSGARSSGHQGMSGASSSNSSNSSRGSCSGTSRSAGAALAAGQRRSSGLNDMSAMNRMGGLNSQQGIGSQGRTASMQQHQLNRPQPMQ
jgi:hypothetical protein